MPPPCAPPELYGREGPAPPLDGRAPPPPAGFALGAGLVPMLRLPRLLSARPPEPFIVPVGGPLPRLGCVLGRAALFAGERGEPDGGFTPAPPLPAPPIFEGCFGERT